jgi:phage shock protein C
MSAYCNNCGTALPPAARFCSACGTVVAGVPPMGAQPYSPYTYPPYPVRLVRPIFGRQFAGVCVGLARTYNWDVGLVRILTVLAGVFIFPVAEIAYIACWIGIPEEQLSEIAPPPQQVPPQQV